MTCALLSGLPTGSVMLAEAPGSGVCPESEGAFEQLLLEVLKPEAELAPVGGVEGSVWVAPLLPTTLHGWVPTQVLTPDEAAQPVGSDVPFQRVPFAPQPMQVGEQPALELAHIPATPQTAYSVVSAGGEEVVAPPYQPMDSQSLLTANPSASAFSSATLVVPSFFEPEEVVTFAPAARRMELLPQAPPAIDSGLSLSSAPPASSNAPLEAVVPTFSGGEGGLVNEARREHAPNPFAEIATPRRRGLADSEPLSFPLSFEQARATPDVAPTDAGTAALADGEVRWQLAEQLSQHIERMVYQREQNSLTVRLDPPELGVIEIRIQAMGTEVRAWVHAEQEATRHMLAQAQQYLREQLEARGLQLTHFDVGGERNFAFARPFRTPLSASGQAVFHTPVATESLVYDGRWSVWV